VELKKLGFTFFNLANNHILDQGVEGLRETRLNLHKLGFNYSGSGDASIDQNSAHVITIREHKIALVGLSMVYHDFDLTKAVKLIGSLKAQTDLVLVNIHWGKEYSHQFSQQQQRIGRALITSGADIVIGHHPHVVQGVEIYQGKPIFYSLGNFIFDQYFSTDTQAELAVSFKISERQVSVQLWPLQSRASAPTPLTGTKKVNFLQQYAGWSAAGSELKRQILQGSWDLSVGVGK
jgi:poly-gamma-glutamate synthesis protein (capsule biosynthesis protein)